MHITCNNRMTRRLTTKSSRHNTIIIKIRQVNQRSLRVPIRGRICIVLQIISRPRKQRQTKARSRPTLRTLLQNGQRLTLPRTTFRIISNRILLTIRHRRMITITLIITRGRILTILQTIITPMSTYSFSNQNFKIFMPHMNSTITIRPIRSFLTSINHKSHNY